MKVLLIMPINEASQYFAMQLMVEAGKAGFDALSVPNYADYLHTVNLAPDYTVATIMALSTTNEFAAEHENCLIIGNCSRAVPFDIIINVNPNHEEGVIVEDLELKQIKVLYGMDLEIGPLINNCYTPAMAESTVGGEATQIIQLVQDLCQAKLN